MRASLWQLRQDADEASWVASDASAGSSRASGGADVRVDAVVIGAGIVGLSAAIELEARGLRVAVLERARAGAGASGRNAGYLMRGAADSYAAAAEAWGREVARGVWRWSEANLAALRALGVERVPGYASRPSALVAMEAEEADELARSRHMLLEDGFGASWLESGDDALWRRGRARAALVNPDDACCDPASLLGWLASMLREPVVTGCDVRSIACADGVARAVTSRGVFEGPRLVLATNALAGMLMPTLGGVITAWRGQMAAYRCARADLAMSYYLNRGGEYVRTGADGLVLAGGMRRFHAEAERTASVEPSAALQADLDSFVRAAFDVGEAELVARWAGTMGFTTDGLPVLAVSGRDGASIGVAAGFTGHGMSLGHLAGREVASAMVEGRAIGMARCTAVGDGFSWDTSPGSRATPG